MLGEDGSLPWVARVGLAERFKSGSVRGCVKKTRNRHAVRKMEVDPPEPSCRRRLQTALSCFGSMTVVVNVKVKRRGKDRVMWGLER